MTDISYQLYSSREFPPLAETLRMLKHLGYTMVEGYGGVYGDVPALTAALDETGLSMASGHFGLHTIEHEPTSVLAIAEAVEMHAVFCPYVMPDERPSDAAGWRAFGERLQKAGEPIRAAGLDFGWHNHDFELKPLDDGTVPLEHIFEGGPDLSWEADLAWVVRGGADPLEWIRRYGDRITAVHVKDIAPRGQCLDEDGWADVGYGTMDWKAIWAALKDAPAAIFVIEHDKPSDHERFAGRSIEAVRNIAQGA